MYQLYFNTKKVQGWHHVLTKTAWGLLIWVLIVLLTIQSNSLLNEWNGWDTFNEMNRDHGTDFSARWYSMHSSINYQKYMPRVQYSILYRKSKQYKTFFVRQYAGGRILIFHSRKHAYTLRYFLLKSLIMYLLRIWTSVNDTSKCHFSLAHTLS